MKIAVCTADAPCLEQTVYLINEYSAQHNLCFDLSIYSRASNLMDDMLRFGGFDIYILDMNMPDQNGIELGFELRQTDRDGKIIYISSASEYAVEAFRVKASGFLLKPPDRDRFFSALDDAVQDTSSRRSKSIVVKGKELYMKFRLDSILYAELVNKTIRYHLISGETFESLTIRTSFSTAAEALLRDERFALCSSVMAVNLYHISSAGPETLYFKNGTKLHIGKRSMRALRPVWTAFWLGT